MTIEEFNIDLLEQIKIDNDAYNRPSEQSLFYIYSGFLQNSGQIEGDEIEIEYGINGYNFSAFSRDIEREALNLYLTDFKSALEPRKIYQKDTDIYFKGLTKLISTTLIPSVEDLDPSNQITEFINDLCSNSKKIKTLTIWKLTNSIYSSRTQSELDIKINDVKVIFRIIDLNAYNSLVTDHDQQNIDISCSLKGIKVIENPYYTSYLTTISGKDLVLYYEEYGKRLLESNVRTFLSLRGKINKGIYNTINSDSKIFFFAYNNGLSGTASDIKFNNGIISSIKNLQIVNGGQTMSTIFKARKDELNIENVHVQVKLSVIHDKENYTSYVSKISEYSNTQNKVNKSDFFSNTYFHRRFKEISKIIRVSGTSSKWFYERVKGEYINDQMYKRDSVKRKFLLEYPKEQVIDKILIAKANLAWELYPYEVAKGAQQPFAKFASIVSDLYDEGDPDCNEYLFKKMVCQFILFRNVEKLVSKASWYNGYRAQTVPYIISFLSYILRNNNLTINWNKIWDSQNIDLKLLEFIELIGEQVHHKLLHPPIGNTNIGTYCKKSICWEGVQKLSRNFKKIPLLNCFTTIKTEKTEELKGKSLEKVDTGLNNQIKIAELSRTKTPKKLIEFYNSKYAPGITDLGMSILKSWYEGRIIYPSEKQAKLISEFLRKAIKSGFQEL
ncbi:AIPR family protein [Flavobacteriaceae bacterium]|nr:AIPR family protein [Flavobacteriaceae bacterium]